MQRQIKKKKKKKPISTTSCGVMHDYLSFHTAKQGPTFEISTYASLPCIFEMTLAEFSGSNI